MQLPHSQARQKYIEQIKVVEANLKDATSGEKDKALLAQVQKRLDSLAEKYQFSEEIGTARYKLYELQALVHYFNGHDDDALDFINQAIDTRGETYAKAEKLKQKLQTGGDSSGQLAPTSAPHISEAERSIISAKRAVDRASFWSLAFGAIYIIIALLILMAGMGAIPFSIIIIAASSCLVYAGWNLNKLKGDDNFIRKMLIINIIISSVSIFTIFPIFILVSSVIALKSVKKYEGRFHKAVKQTNKIMQRTYDYQNSHSIFFYRSPVVVVILNIATLGFYQLYWVYKHWSMIRKSTGESIHPVLSSIFQVFTIYPLMKRVKYGAKLHGYSKFTNAGWAAAGFIVLLLLTNGLNKAEVDAESTAVAYIILSLIFASCTGLIMAVVQRAANAHNRAVLGERHEYKKFFIGEIVMVIIGILIALATIGLTLNSANQGSVNYISPEATNAYNRMELLRSQYESCSDDLDARRDSVNTYSDYEVSSFNNDLQSCEDTRLELNRTVDEYNRLAGFEE